MAGLKLDVMPSDPGILGFSNRWYAHVMRRAFKARLSSDIEIRVADAPSFIATKLEAFLDRGAGDYLSSHDLEDVLSIVDGRPELVGELRAADPQLRAFVGTTLADLLADEGFLNALPGLVLEGSPAVRTPIVLQRLRQLLGRLQRRHALSGGHAQAGLYPAHCSSAVALQVATGDQITDGRF